MITDQEKNNRGRILTGMLILLVLTIVLGVSGFLNQRKLEREAGFAHGYTAGYSIGYTDHLNGLEQNSQELAGRIVPYEAGSGKWKYFIMGFADGYADGYADGLTGENVWNTNES